MVVMILPLLSGCKSSKKVIKEKVEVETVRVEKNKKKKKGEGTDIGEKIVKEALTWKGTPYGYARQEKGVATDCSGMVMIVYQEIANIKLPRNSAQQAAFCDELKEKDVRAGDLVFFATGKDKNKISHVGVMIDGCQFVHASSSKGVIVSEMTTPYYIRTFKKYGRVPR